MAPPTFSTNGYTTGGSSADEAIDHLYAWIPPQTAPQPCPEAAFSLTLRGRLDGQDAMLSVRAQTAAEFTANLQAIRGLLDAPTVLSVQVPQGKEWCAVHQVAMTLNQKEGRSWWSHYDEMAGRWCKGK